MQYTESFNIQKPDYNNIVDIMVLNKNFERIDKGLVLNAGYSTGNDNTYVLTIPNIKKLTSEDIGASFKFFAHKDSTGYVSIKINDGEAKPLYDGKKKQVKKILTGVPYTIVWDGNLNFFLSSGGVDESDETTVGTDGSKVLEGETFIGSDGEIHTGTMPNIGQQTATINAGGKVVITKGYHNGTGYVQANTMAKQMQDLGSTLTSASQLVNGIKAVDKNGNLITGTATIQSLGGKEYKTGSNVATTQHVWGSGSYRVMSYVDNFRVIAGKISYKDKIFVYINDSSICSYPITVCWDDKNSRYSVGTASNEFSPSQPSHVGIPVFYDSTNNNSIVVTNYIAWE